MFVLQLRKLPVLNTIKDGSAVVTGILLAYTLPPSVPWYVPVVGSFFAITIVKHTFGGLGKQYLESGARGACVPAGGISGVINSDWRILNPDKLFHNITKVDADGKLLDAVTRATPLAKEAGAETYRFAELIIGNVPGCIGETSAIALLLGGFYLIYKRYIKWYVPACYVAVVFFMSMFLPPRVATPWANNPLYHVFAGGLLLGAFFMSHRHGHLSLTKKGLIILP